MLLHNFFHSPFVLKFIKSVLETSLKAEPDSVPKLVVELIKII